MYIHALRLREEVKKHMKGVVWESSKESYLNERLNKIYKYVSEESVFTYVSNENTKVWAVDTEDVKDLISGLELPKDEEYKEYIEGKLSSILEYMDKETY